MLARVFAILLVGYADLALAQAPKPIKLAVVKADAPEHVKAYFRRANEARPILAKYFEKSIVQQRISIRKNPSTDPEHNRIVNLFLDNDLRKLEMVQKRYDAPIPIGRELAVGAIGKVLSVTVRQVIDANRVLVEVRTRTETYTVDRITESGANNQVVLLDIPTAGLEKDQKLYFEELLEVTGTAPFELRPGVPKDLFVLKPIDVKQYLVEAP